MTDHYQLVTIKNAHEDGLDIVAQLRKMQQGTLVNDLRLLNYYNEIPVSYPATIDYIEDDMVDLAVHQHQIVVMKHDKKTLLKSKHFPHEVLANVFRANLNSGLATLTNFAYAVVRAERRRFVRVAIRERVEVLFTDGERQVRGYLLDISLCGVALVSGEQSPIETQAEGALLLSIAGKPISMPAKLVKIAPVGSEIRYIFETETSAKEEALISQFIFQRQVEIIKELKEVII